MNETAGNFAEKEKEASERSLTQACLNDSLFLTAWEKRESE